jgi:hypothetical protein
MDLFEKGQQNHCEDMLDNAVDMFQHAVNGGYA